MPLAIGQERLLLVHTLFSKCILAAHCGGGGVGGLVGSFVEGSSDSLTVLAGVSGVSN